MSDEIEKSLAFSMATPTVSIPEMSLRDYFAAKAIDAAWDWYKNTFFDPENWNSGDVSIKVSNFAFQIADEMLRSRKP